MLVLENREGYERKPHCSLLNSNERYLSKNGANSRAEQRPLWPQRWLSLLDYPAETRETDREQTLNYLLKTNT